MAPLKAEERLMVLPQTLVRSRSRRFRILVRQTDTGSLWHEMGYPGRYSWRVVCRAALDRRRVARKVAMASGGAKPFRFPIGVNVSKSISLGV